MRILFLADGRSLSSDIKSEFALTLLIFCDSLAELPKVSLYTPKKRNGDNRDCRRQLDPGLHPFSISTELEFLSVPLFSREPEL
jgi:hypothetical protein